MITYFIYTIISLGGAFALYFLLLRTQKTFQFNRFYLIGSLLLCLIAPFLEIELFSAVPRLIEIPAEPFTVSNVVTENIDNVSFEDVAVVNESQVSPVFYMFLVISFLLVFRFLKNLFKLYRLTRGKYEGFGKLKLIRQSESNMVSSFFNYMFIHENQNLENDDFLNIVKHETVHYQQWHSLDVILMELLICLFWFNPLVWLYKKAILQNHEYIADDLSVSSGIDIENYANSIINLGHKEHRVPLTSGFNFIQIKNRIIMLHQSKSSLLKRTVNISSVLLLFAGIFVFSSCKADLEDALVEDTLIVVIDAAHGGHDDGNLNEKDVVLNISNKLSLMSSAKIKIITTRDNDTFSTLEERTNFMNAQNPDIVISLHCNAHSDVSIDGIEAYYNDNNEFKEKTYAYSKILLENQMDVFSTNRGLKTAGMYVLRHATRPAVVLELGFLTNDRDKAILMNSEKQKEIAESIFEALEEIRVNN
ncbi:MAG: N-acetylmuramoyl-L-alanine amidase [Winogradskyella sp.]|uniref:N-acetylmuramoyl-L-alanine amidase n=1 Tax=Winogradskyella sp. TaxID=1883156 RepID=UPI00385D14C8